jgi:hypothetical protein
MHLTWTASVESVHLRRPSAKTCSSCQKHESLHCMHDLPSPGTHRLANSFITSLNPNPYTALTTQNTTENYFIYIYIYIYIYKTHISLSFSYTHTHTHTHTHRTALQQNVFFTWMHRLLVTNKGRSVFPVQAAVSSISVCRPRYLLLYSADIRLFSIKTEEKELHSYDPYYL